MGVIDKLLHRDKSPSSNESSSRVVPATTTSQQPSNATNKLFTADTTDIYSIAQHMCGLKGCTPILLSTQKYRFRTYKHVFSANECIIWLINHHYSTTVIDAVNIANRLLQQHIICKLTGNGTTFAHNNNLYRFDGDYKLNRDPQYTDTDIQRLKLQSIDYKHIVDELITAAVKKRSDNNGNKQKLTHIKRLSAEKYAEKYGSVVSDTVHNKTVPAKNTTKPTLRDKDVSVQHSAEAELEQQLNQRRNDGGFTGTELCQYLLKCNICTTLYDTLIIGNWMLQHKIINFVAYDESVAKQLFAQQQYIHHTTKPTHGTADKYKSTNHSTDTSNNNWLTDNSIHPQSAPDRVSIHRPNNNNSAWLGVVHKGISAPTDFKHDNVWYQMPCIARQRSHINLFGTHIQQLTEITDKPHIASTITYEHAYNELTKQHAQQQYDPSYAANWEFVQSFGDDTTAYEYDDADDLVTAVEFSDTGQYLAIGDKAGRVSIVQETCTVSNKQNTVQALEYEFCSEFQAHVPEFDSLKSIEVECKINCIEWLHTQHSNNISLLTANDKSIKLWRIQQKSNPVMRQQHKLQQQAQKQQDITDDIPITATCKAVYSTAHNYNIHSISHCSDGSTFISADDLRINVWNYDYSHTAYNIVDLKPADMTGIDELITAAQYHPIHSYELLHGSSKGITNIVDLRTYSIIDKHTTNVLQFKHNRSKKTYFTEITDSILDATYSHCGQYILTRDYMQCSLWDVRMSTQPVYTSYVHPQLQSQYLQLLDNEAIFDQFQCSIAPNTLNYVTGTYSHCFTLHSVVNNTTTTIKAKDDAREPCVVNEWQNTAEMTAQYNARQPKRTAITGMNGNNVNINANATEQGQNMILHNNNNNTIHVNNVAVGANNGGINIINNSNGAIHININNTQNDTRMQHKLLYDNSFAHAETPKSTNTGFSKFKSLFLNTDTAGSNIGTLPGSVDTSKPTTPSFSSSSGSRTSSTSKPSPPSILRPYSNIPLPNYSQKMLKVAWHPTLNAVAVAGLYKLYLYQTKVTTE